MFHVEHFGQFLFHVEHFWAKLFHVEHLGGSNTEVMTQFGNYFGVREWA